MNKKDYLEITKEVINGLNPDFTAQIVKSLSEKLDEVNEIEVPTVNIDNCEEIEEDSIDDEVKSFMEEYGLTQNEVEEVKSISDDFNGSIDTWDMEDLKPNQKKLLVDLLYDSDSLYVDDDEIINYETLHDRACEDPEEYIDLDMAIEDRWLIADKEELLKALG